MSGNSLYDQEIKEETNMEEKGKKRGIFSMIKESLNKTGGCCGGDGCCGPTKEADEGNTGDKTTEERKKQN